MLTKGQKIYMYISAILGMLIGAFVLVPFRTLPGLFTAENAENLMKVELWIKCVILPLVVVGLSVFANVKKYQELNDSLDRSKVVNVMSYFPMASYLCGLLVFAIHTLVYSPYLLGFNAWAIIVILLVLYLTFIVVGFHVFSNVLFRLDVVGTGILDAVVGTIVVCFAFITWRISADYFQEFASDASFIGSGDPLLFFIYVVAVITFIVLCIRLVPLFKKDNRSIYVGEEVYQRNYERLVRSEYNRAYNDIMDDFEIYFKEHCNEPFDPRGQKEEIEEVHQVCPKCGTELIGDNKFCTSCGTKLGEKQEVESTTEEKNDESTEEKQEVEPTTEEVQENENVQEKQETLVEEKVVEEKPTQEVQTTQEEKVVEETEPSKDEKEEVIERKVIDPSYQQVVDFATSIRNHDMKVTSNSKNTVHKYYYKKKLFLISQDTYNDYRLIFLCDKYKAIELINLYPGTFVKPLTPKGECWFKVINRGDLSKEFIEELINGSVEIVEKREEEFRLRKEAAKANAESSK